MVDIIEQISQFENYWGQGLDEPLIAIENVLVGPGYLQIVGQNKGRPTLKIQTKSGITCIKFSSSKEEYDSLYLEYDTEPQYFLTTIVGRASINEYRGQRTPQLKIVDYHVQDVVYDF